MEQFNTSGFVIHTDGSHTFLQPKCHSQECLQSSILRKMYDGDSRLCDVSLFGVPPPGVPATSLHPIRAHKNVLIYASKHLNELLTSDNYTDSHQNDYRVEIVDHESLRRIVEFIYTDRLTVTAEDAVDVMCRVFIGADYLVMKDLAQKCEAFLAGEEQVQPTTCVKLWSFARKYSCFTLMHATSIFMVRYLAEMPNNIHFLRMPYADCAKLFLSEALVGADTDERCLAAIAWLSYDSDTRKLFVSDIINMIPLEFDSVLDDTLYEALRCDMLWKHAPDVMRKISTLLATKQLPQVVNEATNSPNSLYILGSYQHEHRKLFLHYDVTRRVWSKLPALPWERWAFGACVVRNRLLAVGGMKNGNISADIDEYDLTTNTWLTSCAKLEVARKGSAVCSDGRRMYVLGGQIEYLSATDSESLSATDCESGVSSDVEYDDVDVVEMYSGQIGIPSKKLASMSEERSYFTAALRIQNEGAENCIYVAEGGDSNDIEKYEIAHNKWSKVGQMISERCSLASALAGEDLYLIGGREWDIDETVNAVEIFNIETGQSRLTKSLARKRESCSATTLYNGNVVCVLGGYNTDDSEMSNEVECMDIREGEWSTNVIIPNMPSFVSNYGFAASYS